MKRNGSSWWEVKNSKLQNKDQKREGNKNLKPVAEQLKSCRCRRPHDSFQGLE